MTEGLSQSLLENFVSKPWLQGWGSPSVTMVTSPGMLPEGLER